MHFFHSDELPHMSDFDDYLPDADYNNPERIRRRKDIKLNEITHLSDFDDELPEEEYSRPDRVSRRKKVKLNDLPRLSDFDKYIPEEEYNHPNRIHRRKNANLNPEQWSKIKRRLRVQWVRDLDRLDQEQRRKERKEAEARAEEEDRERRIKIKKRKFYEERSKYVKRYNELLEAVLKQETEREAAAKKGNTEKETMEAAESDEYREWRLLKEKGEPVEPETWDGECEYWRNGKRITEKDWRSGNTAGFHKNKFETIPGIVNGEPQDIVVTMSMSIWQDDSSTDSESTDHERANKARRRTSKTKEVGGGCGVRKKW